MLGGDFLFDFAQGGPKWKDSYLYAPKEKIVKLQEVTKAEATSKQAAQQAAKATQQAESAAKQLERKAVQAEKTR